MLPDTTRPHTGPTAGRAKVACPAHTDLSMTGKNTNFIYRGGSDGSELEQHNSNDTMKT
jgi:hypothetical protein